MFVIHKVLKALSDNNRIKILWLLSQKPLCVCELQSILKIAQSTVSSHLSILQKTALIKRKKEGLWVIYHFVKHNNNDISGIVKNILHYLDADKKNKTLLDTLSKVDRFKICQVKWNSKK